MRLQLTVAFALAVWLDISDDNALVPNYEGMIISKVHRESIGDLSQRRPVAAHPQPAATSQPTRAADPPAPRPKIKVESAQSNGNTAAEPDLIGGKLCLCIHTVSSS